MFSSNYGYPYNPSMQYFPNPSIINSYIQIKSTFSAQSAGIASGNKDSTYSSYNIDIILEELPSFRSRDKVTYVNPSRISYDIHKKL